MMISFDDAIELFKELGQYIKAEDPGKYDCAINRLNYENEKAKGAKEPVGILLQGYRSLQQEHKSCEGPGLFQKHPCTIIQF